MSHGRRLSASRFLERNAASTGVLQVPIFALKIGNAKANVICRRCERLQIPTGSEEDLRMTAVTTAPQNADSGITPNA
jgi:hypothetical protein